MVPAWPHNDFISFFRWVNTVQPPCDYEASDSVVVLQGARS